MLMHPTLYSTASVVGLLSTYRNLNVSHAIDDTPFEKYFAAKGTLCI